MKNLNAHRQKMNRRIFQMILFFVLISLKINAQSDTIQTNVPALKNVFKNDFYIGCLLSYRNIGFASDPQVPGQSGIDTPQGGYLIKFHMNSMSPGNNMKPQYTIDMTGSASAYNSATTQVAKDSIDVNPLVKFNGSLIAQLNWAKRQGFTFRGHTLVWHSQTPGTGFFRKGYSSSGERLTKERMTLRLENYIKEVIRTIHESWPGLLSAFDVVNEAVNDNGSDRTTDSEWYTTFGDNSYVMKAFEFTRKYTVLYNEKQIKLYYNDYNTSTSTKATGIVRLCKPIYDAGYLDGLGMQEHDQYNNPSAASWIATYDKFYPICNEMAITELDVKPSSDNLTASVLESQANQYAQLVKCFVERSYFSGRGKIINVSKDGLNDNDAFVKKASLWDGYNQCKPAFYAVVNVGIAYNKLDSLVKASVKLKENEYTTDSWTKFADALAAAQTAMKNNYNYGVSAVDGLSNAIKDLTSAKSSLVIKTTAIESEKNMPYSYSLSQNYPNPFNPTTKINYSIKHTGFVSLKVFNLLGKEIATLVNQEHQPGSYNVTFNGEGLSNGMYLYRLTVNNYTETKKFILLK